MKNEPVRALFYLNSVLGAYDSNTTLLDYAAIYNNIAAAEVKAGNYVAASSAFDKSNAYATKDNIPYILMENYRNMSDMYARMKNPINIRPKKHKDIKDLSASRLYSITTLVKPKK